MSERDGYRLIGLACDCCVMSVILQIKYVYTKYTLYKFYEQCAKLKAFKAK